SRGAGSRRPFARCLSLLHGALRQDREDDALPALVMGPGAMIHIVCFGNAWQGDDGFGIHVFRRLREMPALPSQVKVFDAGTAGLSALGYFEDCKKAVIVDAVKAGGRVGRVRRFRLEDFDPPGPELSLHAVGVHHLLLALPVVLGPGAMPEVVVIGAE